MSEEQLGRFEPQNEGDKVLWDTESGIGEMVFTIDGKHIYNLFADYPDKLTPEDLKIFNKENPFWVGYFRDRLVKYFNDQAKK